MKKYILISKDHKDNTFTLYESDDYKFIYHKYKLWKGILQNESLFIFSKIEE